jgi:hypothetical protein
MESKRIGNYLIEVEVDDNPDCPRGWDNLGTMVCFHNRYGLGDKHNYTHANYSGWDEMKKSIIKNENVGVILPLYLYDHSGITMNTTGFSCGWDSGRVGFVFVSKEKILKEFGGKIVTKKLKEKVTQNLIGEVETYDQYLRGDVYGYTIYKITERDLGGENKEEVDSCWGYYGIDECMQQAENIVQGYIS